MPRICAICGKRPLNGNKISHANNKTKKVSKPNLQKVRISQKGGSAHAMVCTRCIRSGATTIA